MGLDSNNVECTPLVTIGLPTFNRAPKLKRAIETVLGQTYQNLELVISDNASTDGTQQLCEEFSRRDKRVKYFRQPTNHGAVANFRAVLDYARGEFFMWLGDDDWLDPGYVGECLSVLIKHPDHQLVCGRGRYFQMDTLSHDESVLNLTEETGSLRVLSYFRQVAGNAALYGIARHEVISSLKLRDVMGTDWLVIADLAFLGKVRTLESVFVNRASGGVSGSAETLVHNHGLPGFASRNPFLFIAFTVFSDIAWKSPIYEPLGKLNRLRLGWQAAYTIGMRFFLPSWGIRTRIKKTVADALSKEPKPFRS